MARPFYPLPPGALLEAVKYFNTGRRSYRRASEPEHPSLRDVARHLRGRKLVRELVPPAVLARALERAGVRIEHWRRSAALRRRRARS